MPSLSFSRFGPPLEVLTLIPDAARSLSPTQVRIRVRLSPINPSDLNYIEGTYGLKPTLPAVAGLEGVGEVIELGSAVKNFSLGQLVRPDRRLGLWRHEVVNEAADILAFPSALTVEQAAVTSVNPPTAWCLLHEFLRLQPGDWIIQNAANSGVGRAVIQIAHALGLRTINLVRRAELIPELQAQGADWVVLDEKAALTQARTDLGKTPIKLALNAVGGDSALAIAKFLSPGGIHVTYGAMARQPLKIPNGLLIFNDLAFRGFWITPWLQKAPPERLALMWSTLTDLWQRGILTPGIEKTYPLEDFRPALTHALQEARQGKILFQLS